MMPTQHQAATSIASFFERSDIFHVVFRPRFDAQCLEFWETGAYPDPHWLATYLAVMGVGLLAMDDEASTSCLMPTGDGRDLLARSWLENSLQALTLGDFLKHPSVESVRAVVILNQFWATWEAGHHLQSAISFNTSVIAAAYDIQLHLDPDGLSSQPFTPLGAEERRRVWWAMVTVDSLARTFLGKTYSPLLEPCATSTRLPSHLPDEAFTSSGDFDFSFNPSSGSRSMALVNTIHSLTLLHHKISHLVLSSPSSDQIMRHHEELQVIDVEHHSSYLPEKNTSEDFSPRSTMSSIVRALLSLAFVRLHRSPTSQTTSTSDLAWHRALCRQHCGDFNFRLSDST
ncbi:hypothetical protein P7C70_g6460, partial [Phenoliferia sp. Uapishka_3]